MSAKSIAVIKGRKKTQTITAYICMKYLRQSFWNIDTKTDATEELRSIINVELILGALVFLLITYRHTTHLNACTEARQVLLTFP